MKRQPYVWHRTGHASQTIVVYPPTGSTAYEREISTPPTVLRTMALIHLFLPLHTQEVQASEKAAQKNFPNQILNPVQITINLINRFLFYGQLLHEIHPNI